MEVLLGSLVSLLAEGYKKHIGEDKIGNFEMEIFVVILAILVGAFIYLFEGTQTWKVVLGVLGSAAGVYNFIIKPAKKAFE